MAASEEEIYRAIPHRPHFLWVDRIVARTTGTIETERDIPENLDIFVGHYPDRPIMPGVLLCEAIFQSGALLLSLAHNEGAIRLEQVGPAWFMKGSLKVKGKSAVGVNCACALTENVN